MSKITDALMRQEPEDIIYIGDVAEKIYHGSPGELLRALINGYQSKEITRYLHDKVTSADTKMGRVEGLQMIIDGLESAIGEKLKHQEDQREDYKDGKAKRAEADALKPPNTF